MPGRGFSAQPISETEEGPLQRQPPEQNSPNHQGGHEPRRRNPPSRRPGKGALDSFDEEDVHGARCVCSSQDRARTEEDEMRQSRAPTSRARGQRRRLEISPLSTEGCSGPARPRHSLSKLRP